jgi:hypothetical protein
MIFIHKLVPIYVIEFFNEKVGFNTYNLIISKSAFLFLNFIYFYVLGTIVFINLI